MQASLLDHVLHHYRLGKMLIGDVDKPGDVARADLRRTGIALVTGDRRADQHVAWRMRHRIDHPAAGNRQGVADIAVVLAPDHDLAEAHQARRRMPAGVDDMVEHIAGRGPGGIDQHAGQNHRPVAVELRFQRQAPAVALALGDDAAQARVDAGATRLRIESIGDREPRIVDDTVGKGEAVAEMQMQRPVGIAAIEVEPVGTRQRPPRQRVIGQETEAERPARPQLLVMRQNEGQRPHQMRRRAHQDAALLEPRVRSRPQSIRPRWVSPPCTTRSVADDDAPAMSPCSHRNVVRPRPAASRAIAEPIRPPPTMARS